MIEKLGFPESLIAIEKGMAAFGYFDTGRRVDILCFRKVKETLAPLLLIECKAEALTDAAEEQLLGYNQTIGAPFIALASRNEVKMFWFERGSLISVPFLPLYSDLLTGAVKR
ncbi:MAG: type I restriction enzyme HsdR N-terminal domain-containing protein [Chlamydiae bacterium]|nr:type I restriction enzyme HsdR N-terminal domain-containing protein [Chlamydiota bacterium]